MALFALLSLLGCSGANFQDNNVIVYGERTGRFADLRHVSCLVARRDSGFVELDLDFFVKQRDPDPLYGVGMNLQILPENDYERIAIPQLLMGVLTEEDVDRLQGDPLAPGGLFGTNFSGSSMIYAFGPRVPARSDSGGTTTVPVYLHHLRIPDQTVTESISGASTEVGGSIRDAVIYCIDGRGVSL